MSTRVRKSSGFTLLEVMVAVIILAVGLSSLFTSQVGAIRIAQRGRMTTIASLLARCKMGEVEEKVLKEGWPGDLIQGDDKCCEGAEHDNFTCEWKVERIVLPELTAEEGDGSGGALDKLKTEGAAGAIPGQPGDPADPTDPVDPAAALGVPLGGIDSMLGGGGTDDDSGGTDPMASLVMSYAFPIMKPLIEEQVRRATVIVSWNEGSSTQTMDIVQFLVNEQPALPTDEEEEDVQSGSGSTGTGTDTGSGGSSTGSGIGGAGKENTGSSTP